MNNPLSILKEEIHEQDNRYITGSVTARVNIKKGILFAAGNGRKPGGF